MNIDVQTVKIAIRMADGFIAFAPRSLEKLTGICEDSAKQHCEWLAKAGRLRRVRRHGEIWYQSNTQ